MELQSVSNQELRALTALSMARIPRTDGGAETEPKGSTSEVRIGPEQGKDASRSAAKQVPEGHAPILWGGTQLRIDAATDRIITQIVNEKREVVKQIPPEDLLKVLAKTREVQGLLFDKKA